MDINTESVYTPRKMLVELRMMLEGTDSQALQTLIENSTMTPEDQNTLIYEINK